MPFDVRPPVASVVAESGALPPVWAVGVLLPNVRVKVIVALGSSIRAVRAAYAIP